MIQNRQKLSGILFLIAGILFVVASIINKKTPFLVIGCTFLALGGSLIRKSRNNQNRNPD